LNTTHPLALDENAQSLACILITSAALSFGRIDPTQADVATRPTVRAKLDIITVNDPLYRAENVSGISGRDGGCQDRQNGRKGKKPYHSAGRNLSAAGIGNHSLLLLC
jgi:hypothetical protein